MAQRPNPTVRGRICQAAAERIAECGYEKATIADIAERAGTASGNVYRYFESKEVLFAELFPDAFAQHLQALVRKRIEALGTARDVRDLGPDAPYHAASEELLRFCIDHRARVVILLRKAEGTPYEGFADRLVNDLVRFATKYARGAWPQVVFTKALRHALTQIYRNYVLALADVLAAFEEEGQIRQAVAHLSAYHLGGLRYLFESLHREGVKPEGDEP